MKTVALRSLRFFSLAVITAYGLLIAFTSQASSQDYEYLTGMVLEGLCLYLLMVGVYLRVTSLKDWKYLLALSILVGGFILELVIRAKSISGASSSL